jgi:hypothetical protein
MTGNVGIVIYSIHNTLYTIRLHGVFALDGHGKIDTAEIGRA